MNDNLIKMFIGGEEVVSNKEFTINEEMLSASSTILNNCYPASWEESKDYVSNFYYPKDYSKYILGKGNFTYGTEQYTLFTESGILPIFQTNNEMPLQNLTINGNSYQYQKSSILPIQYQELEYIESTGTQWLLIDVIPKRTDYLKLEADIKWTQSSSRQLMGSNVGGYYFGINESGKYEVGGGVVSTISGATNSYDHIVFEKMKYPDLNTNLTVNGTLACNRSYGGADNPYKLGILQLNSNPLYSFWCKASIKNVKVYLNDVLVFNGIPCYKVSDKSIGMYDLVNKIFYSNNGTGNFNKGSEISSNIPTLNNISPILNVYTINLFDNTKFTPANSLIWTYYGDLYAYPIYIGVGNYATFSTNVPIVEGNNTVYAINNLNLYSSNRVTENEPRTIAANSEGYVYIGYGTSRPYYNQILNGEYWLMVNVGRNIESFVPYNNIKYTIKGKNLFNENNLFKGYYYPTNPNDLVSDNNYRTMIIDELPPGTYTFSTNLENTRILRWWGDNQNHDISQDINKLTITTTTTNNVLLTFRKNPIEAIEDNFYVMFENGSIASAYEKFKEESALINLKGNELVKLPSGIKDEIVVDNQGNVKIIKKTGKKILNGVDEIWNSQTGSHTYIANYYTSMNNWGAIPAKKSIYSNVGVFSSMAGSTNDTNPYIIAPNSIGTNLLFDVLLSQYPTISSLTDKLKELANNNNPMTVYYELLNSYEIELDPINPVPTTINGQNNIILQANLNTDMIVSYYWKNYDVLFAGIVKNSGDISLKPTNPKYCSLQILDYKTFLSESDTLDFVISDKTIAEAISMVVDAIRGYGFILGTINISQADDIIGAYSTLNKTAYDVFQYLANISGSRWRARFVDSDTMAIDFYDPELLPRANDIDYTQQYWEDNKIVDLTFNYGTRDYRNKQIILSDEVYGGIDYTEVLLSNGYGTSYITQNNIANITSITVNGVEAEVITQSEKDLGVDADFYYTPGKNVVESTTSYTAGTQIIITYTPLVKGRQIVYNDEEVTRIATQTNTTGVISRYENRNDILSSDELENIAETYIKYKGKPEIILKLTTLNNDLFSIGEICYFNSPIADLAQDYMVKSKATNYTSVAGETNIFYTYELTSSFNSEKAINYFDNQRNKATGNIAEGESITRNIDINNSAMIIWENATITEISVSVDGDNALNSVLNSPFIQ